MPIPIHAARGFSFLALCLVTLAATSASSSLQPSPNAIDAVLRGAVDHRRIPGVVAVVAAPDRVIYRAAFGKRNEASGAPMTADTIFRIYSMTKPITSVAVMQLAEAGKVKLDEPASTYLPAIAGSQVIDHFDAESGRAALRPPKTPVTIRELLSHTSGFVYDMWDQELYDYRRKLSSSGMPPGEMAEPLLFDPGTKWEYGTGVTWLGRIVETVSGQSLEGYFREHILDPLGMDDTSFNVTPEKQDRLITMHQQEADGTLREFPPQPVQPARFYDGGGGLYSTAADYVKFMQAILGGGQLGKIRILRPETVAMMEKNQIGSLMLQDFQSTSTAVSMSGSLPGGLEKFGLGFAITTKAVPGGRAAGSVAWAGLANTFFWIDPSNKIACVLMTQVMPFLEPGPIGVLKEFEHAVYASKGRPGHP